MERDLITIKGRASGPGRPILYGTTSNFLKALGLNALEDLPKLREINEILKNEKIEGITEADIDLFNSVNTESNLFSAGTVNTQITTDETENTGNVNEDTGNSETENSKAKNTEIENVETENNEVKDIEAEDSKAKNVELNNNELTIEKDKLQEEENAGEEVKENGK